MLEEERYYIRYHTYLLGSKVEGADGDMIVWSTIERPPQVGDYDEVEMGGLNVQRVLVEVMKIAGEG